MAKTITEMSKDYVNEQGMKEAYNGSCDSLEVAYTKGANAVLEEIQSIIKDTGGDGSNYHFNLYVGLKNMIKELKGE